MRNIKDCYTSLDSEVSEESMDKGFFRSEKEYSFSITLSKTSFLWYGKNIKKVKIFDSARIMTHKRIKPNKDVKHQS